MFEFWGDDLNCAFKDRRRCLRRRRIDRQFLENHELDGYEVVAQTFLTIEA